MVKTIKETLHVFSSSNWHIIWPYNYLLVWADTKKSALISTLLCMVTSDVHTKCRQTGLSNFHSSLHDYFRCSYKDRFLLTWSFHLAQRCPCLRSTRGCRIKGHPYVQPKPAQPYFYARRFSTFHWVPFFLRDLAHDTMLGELLTEYTLTLLATCSKQTPV